MINLTFKRNNKESVVSFPTIAAGLGHIKTEYGKRHIFKGELTKIHSDDPAEARMIAFVVNAIQKKEREKGNKVTPSEITVIQDGILNTPV